MMWSQSNMARVRQRHKRMVSPFRDGSPELAPNAVSKNCIARFKSEFFGDEDLYAMHRQGTSDGAGRAVNLTARLGGNNFLLLMPLYEYRCTKCRKRFSLEQGIGEHGKRRPACPKCKSRAVEPMFSTFFAKTGRKS
jgi:putative FmdB family regulatory protein